MQHIVNNCAKADIVPHRTRLHPGNIWPGSENNAGSAATGKAADRHRGPPEDMRPCRDGAMPLLRTIHCLSPNDPRIGLHGGGVFTVAGLRHFQAILFF